MSVWFILALLGWPFAYAIGHYGGLMAGMKVALQIVVPKPEGDLQ